MQIEIGIIIGLLVIDIVLTIFLALRPPPVVNITPAGKPISPPKRRSNKLHTPRAANAAQVERRQRETSDRPMG